MITAVVIAVLAVFVLVAYPYLFMLWRNLPIPRRRR